MNVMTPLGAAEVIKVLTLVESQSLATPDWTDEDLCNVVAQQLGVDPVEVAVAEPPPNLVPSVPPQGPEVDSHEVQP